jgi:hypothetical protein
VPDAWIDENKTKVGYEIPLNRHFYRYEPPRPLEVIEIAPRPSGLRHGTSKSPWRPRARGE